MRGERVLPDSFSEGFYKRDYVGCRFTWLLVYWDTPRPAIAGVAGAGL